MALNFHEVGSREKCLKMLLGGIIMEKCLRSTAFEVYRLEYRSYF